MWKDFETLGHITDKIFKLPEKYRLQERLIREAGHGECDKCPAVWKLELRDLGPKEVCLIITWWIDLGPGLSRIDFRWENRTSIQPLAHAPDGKFADPRLLFERDSLQASAPGALSEQALLKRNLAILRERKPKTVGIRVVVE